MCGKSRYNYKDKKKKKKDNLDIKGKRNERII